MSELTIESAIEELREMFPEREFNASSIVTVWKDGLTRTRGEVVVYGGRSAGNVFAENSLREAMIQVRKWRKEQQ